MKKLSQKQREMILRLLNDPVGWRMPKDGRKAHGWDHTLHSLKRLGYVSWLLVGEERKIDSGDDARGRIGQVYEFTGPGWILTEEGWAYGWGLKAPTHCEDRNCGERIVDGGCSVCGIMYEPIPCAKCHKYGFHPRTCPNYIAWDAGTPPRGEAGE